MSSGSEPLSMKVDSQGVVKLVGEIDYTVTPKLRASIHGHIKKTSGPMRMDISGVRYLDSAGLAVFIEARRLLMDAKRSLTLENVTPEVKKIFDLTQVSQLFNL